MQNVDAVIIGAGHNGLVAAAYLAKAGKKVLVLERRAEVGGIVVTEEIFPGFKYSTGAHLAGQFSKAIIADLELKRHGLEILPFHNLLFAPGQNGNSLLIPRDPAGAAESIARLSTADAAKFNDFCGLFRKLAAFLPTLYGLHMPEHASPESPKPMDLIKFGWKFHRLGKKEMHEFLRILPMSIADLLNEWFDNELLKATIAAGGLLGSFVGPRQQGTAYLFLHHQLGESNGAFRIGGFVRGGAGNLAQALARAVQQHGAEIRTQTEAVKVVTRDGAAMGVMLQNGDEIFADVVISNADVKRTFLKLVEPTYLDPVFLLQVKNIRSRGTTAKVNFALDALPKFACAAESLGGIVHIGPTLDYLEHAADDAKYGRFSKQPFLEIVIPSIIDSALAPARKHVMSVWVQAAPYHLADANWADQREALGDRVTATIEDYAPGFKELILHRQILTPLDLEQTFALTEGHVYHAELALDQIFFMRPIPGWAHYRTPIENLYLCGSGTHPGGGITGLPGYYAAKTILNTWPKRR
jgi:phytoene dehydrogenase-like protein